MSVLLCSVELALPLESFGCCPHPDHFEQEGILNAKVNLPTAKSQLVPRSVSAAISALSSQVCALGVHTTMLRQLDMVLLVTQSMLCKRQHASEQCCVSGYHRSRQKLRVCMMACRLARGIQEEQ